MAERAFDVVVIAFGVGTNESLAGSLCRIIGIGSDEAEQLARHVPGVVVADVAYARAESLAASLQLAGAEVRVIPHDQPLVPSERARATLLEIGDAMPRLADEELSALRFEGTRRPAPTTLCPLVANDVEAVASEPEQGVPVESATQPTPDVAPAPASKLATEFGSDLDRELQLGVAMRPHPENPPVPAPRSVDDGRISLGFPEAFAPLKTGVRAARPLSASERKIERAAAELYAPAPVAPAFAAIAKQRPFVARATRASTLPQSLNEKTGEERVDVFEDLRAGLSARTVWLLGALWLSVALLLWSNDLLF